MLEIDNWIDSYLVCCRIEKNLSINSIESYRFDLFRFRNTVVSEGIAVRDIDKAWLIQYKSTLLNSNEYQITTIIRHCSSIRQFFQFICEETNSDENPADGFSEVPAKSNFKLPPTFSVSQMAAILEQPDVETFFGLRDRAMLELMYASGLRVTELCMLTKKNINKEELVINIIGKGSKERKVPLLAEVSETLEIYETEALKYWPHYGTSNYVFLSSHFKPMTRQNFWLKVKKYVGMAEIKESFSPHTIRHTFAYHMLMSAGNNPEVLLFLQMFLGHKNLATTEKYLGLTPFDLKSKHKSAHPRG